MKRNPLLHRLTNTGLRGTVLAGRLLLMLVLARFLPVEEVGLFGLFFVTVNFGLMLAGLELHAFSNRELVGASDSARAQIVFNQLISYSAMYLLLVPGSLLLFETGQMPWRVCGFFVVLLVLEHLSYEAYRLFILLGRPMTASMVGFMRGASWVLLLPALFLWREDLQTLEVVFSMWILGGLLSLLYATIALRRLHWDFSGVSLDRAWIIRGLKVALPFFIGTLAIRGVFTLDRYFVEDMSGLALVGVYTFYTGICVALLGLIDASIFSFSYPRLISVANACDSNTFSRLMRRFFVHTAVATLCLAIAIYYLSVPLIQLVDNAIYLEYMNMLKLLLYAYSLFILSMVPQYGLYAIRSDMAILRGNLVALFAFLASIIVLDIYRPGLTSVPEAMIIAFAAMLVVKSWYLQRGTRVFFTAAGSLGEQRTP